MSEDRKKNKYGYPIREAFKSESNWFLKNMGVAGFASEDHKIVLNPHRTLTDTEKKFSLSKRGTALIYVRAQNNTKYNSNGSSTKLIYWDRV